MFCNYIDSLERPIKINQDIIKNILDDSSKDENPSMDFMYM